MPGDGAQDGVRAAEVVAALSLATDLGTGQPLERGLRATLAACRVCDRLGVDEDATVGTYYTCLLLFIGCTADAPGAAQLFPGDVHEQYLPTMFGRRSEMIRGLMTAIAPPGTPIAERVARVAVGVPRALATTAAHLNTSCEVAKMLSTRLGLPAPVVELLGAVNERWDGGGPFGLAGEQVPLPVRIAQVVRDATFQREHAGPEYAEAVLRDRAGHAFDPELVEEVLAGQEEIFAVEAEPGAWDEVVGRDPIRLQLVDDQIDQALAAIGDFTDLLSPRLTGHSSQVASLASAAATSCGLPAAEVSVVRRAGLVHDVGRVAVAVRIWNKDGPLTADEWERARLHPYYTERVLDRSPFLRKLADVASAHHERLDGSGYHRGVGAAALPRGARILAAADAFRSLLEPRGDRPAYQPHEAARLLATEVESGALDADAVAAVVEAAGLEKPALSRPCGLTEREVQVVALLARGMLTKQVARTLGISPKTADRHLQNAYEKIGISSRSALTLFAMQHGLAAWGELPMGTADSRS